MTTTQKAIVAFWVVILSLAAWEAYSYNSNLNQQGLEHPKPQQYFFYPPSDKPDANAQNQIHLAGADVQQTNYRVETDVPSSGMFTCHVTLKNVGNAKATGVQIMVRPYRGSSSANEDGGRFRPMGVLSEDDPLSKFGKYVSFPDLAPGEAATADVTFLRQSALPPGQNPNPSILFQSEKKAAPVQHKLPPGGG